MAMNLNPEYGVQLISLLTKLANGDICDIAERAFNATQKLGENHTTEEFAAKWMAFQTKYNNECQPVFTKCNEAFDRYTDAATYRAKAEIEKGFTGGGTGMEAASSLGAAIEDFDASKADLS